jgi:beta-glucosidase/6-phospho-beta-glucosidase/beta-galactosidase
VNYYRFSISWSRILPSGDSKEVNLGGVQYYTNLIDALLDGGITPMVAMHYFDMPEILYNQGGWGNSSTIKLFEDYARILFTRFGSRVHHFFSVLSIFIY